MRGHQQTRPWLSITPCPLRQDREEVRTKAIGAATDLEFSGQNSPGVDVAGVGLDAFVVAKDLGGGSRRHRSQQQRVADSKLGDLGLQGRPVVKVGRSHVPHVVLDEETKTMFSGWFAMTQRSKEFEC